MRTKTIRQTAIIKASAEAVYDALMDSEQHSECTENPAHITPRPGGAMDAYDGYITGRFLELEPNRLIMQLWRAEEDGWPEDHFSTVTITLTPRDNQTAIGLIQTEVPLEHVKAIAAGWKEYYWKPLRAFLEQST